MVLLVGSLSVSCVCLCVCMHIYTLCVYICMVLWSNVYCSVVVELGTELNTESVLRWKQDIVDNMKDDSDNDNAATPITVPFLLLGSKQDKASTL